MKIGKQILNQKIKDIPKGFPEQHQDWCCQCKKYISNPKNSVRCSNCGGDL